MGSNKRNASKGQELATTKSDTPVKFVLPSESGKGLPYAPEDWPNPGDTWGWKVGRRIRNDGKYKDRFLSVPESLQEKPSKPIVFASKVSVHRYIESQFPGADIDAFFTLFTWDIPAELPQGKDSISPQLLLTFPQSPPSRQKELANGNSGETSKKTVKATPKRKSRASTAESAEKISHDMSLEKEEEKELTEGSSKTSKKTRKATGKQKGRASTRKLFERTPSSGDTNKSTGSENLQIQVSHSQAAAPPGYSGSRTPIKCRAEVQDPVDESNAGLTHEEFDGYVNSLDEMLSMPFFRTEVSFEAEAITMDEAREKLSSLLALGFSNLASSNRLNELCALSTKLQDDPNLSSAEHSMLKLIQEIPLTYKRFLEARRVSQQAGKFFAELDAKVASIAALRSEYSSSKDDMEVLQAEEASVMSDITELEEQIASLQARRQQMTQTIKGTNKRIVHFTSVQQRVMESLPKIVREIQMANSVKQEWEVKRKRSAEQVGQILEKYSPLERFSL